MDLGDRGDEVWRRCADEEAGLFAMAAGLSNQDDLVEGQLQPIDSGLGQQGI